MTAVRRLDVLLHGQLTGRIEIHRNRSATFSYTPETVTDHAGQPLLSCSLPVAAERVGPVPTRNWFANLLPEGEQRAAAAAAAGVPAYDDFALLEAIGWECAGAVAVGPEGFKPNRGGHYQPLTDDEVAARLDTLPQWPVAGGGEVRSSLGGVQSKLLLARTQEGWALPLEGALSTHIVKPEKIEYPGMAAAEGWAMTVASAATPAAEVSLHASAQGRPALMVTRYDREPGNGGTRRIHQEDGCQMLGSPPLAKYADSRVKNEDGTPAVRPSLVKISRVLRQYARNPREQLQVLLRQVIVNMALCNADAHAKNTSVLLTPDGLTVSPLYDVVPTLAFLPASVTTGLWVGGMENITRMTRSHLADEGAAWGVPRRIAEKTVDETLDRLDAALDTATERFPSVPADIPMLVKGQIDRLRQD